MTRKYIVQLWSNGKAGEWEEISADSELEAAEKTAGTKLRMVGKLGELRARVRVVGNLDNETTFYAEQ
jgi:hypothetical protein